MSNKLKKLARAHAAKTGMTYQAAWNDLKRADTRRAEAAGERAAVIVNDSTPSLAAAVGPEPERSIEALLGLLRADAADVLVGNVLPGSSPSLEIAQQRAKELSENPKYWGESPEVRLLISRDERDRLLAAGAKAGTLSEARERRFEQLMASVRR